MPIEGLKRHDLGVRIYRFRQKRPRPYVRANVVDHRWLLGNHYLTITANLKVLRANARQGSHGAAVFAEPPARSPLGARPISEDYKKGRSSLAVSRLKRQSRREGSLR